ncbi:MAG TPA: GFA family protein, partial [Myxococcota bacterium]|nr:GFA family protein [Myxococcota bacterium]
MFPLSDFEWSRGKPAVYASTPGVERSFCRTCGTTLTFVADFMPGLVDVTVASFEDPAALSPQMHIWDVAS